MQSGNWSIMKIINGDKLYTLKPDLHWQFLCDKYIWSCRWQQFFVGSSKFSAPLMTLDSRDTNRDTRAQCPVGVWEIGTTYMLTQYLSHFLWRVVYTSNFRMWQLLFVTLKLTGQLLSKYICHIKIDQFFSSTRANKNFHIKIVRINSPFIKS